MKIHHIGYLVKDIIESKSVHESLGYQCVSEILFDESRGIEVLFMRNDSYVIELVCPKDETSIVWSMLKKRKSGPYHFCYETDDIESCVNEFCMSGFVQVTQPAPAPPHGSIVVFLTSEETGLLEFIERRDSNE
jgi:methylmalonyl-CoA/ethylmalonyl-CoA epimerase